MSKFIEVPCKEGYTHKLPYASIHSDTRIEFCANCYKPFVLRNDMTIKRKFVHSSGHRFGYAFDNGYTQIRPWHVFIVLALPWAYHNFRKSHGK